LCPPRNLVYGYALPNAEICSTRHFADENFADNFSKGQHFTSIKDEGKIYTACGNGKIPFVSTQSIAAVAFHALIDTNARNIEYIVLGPELLTHDHVAAKLSEALGREIVHVKISQEQSVERLLSLGMPEIFAKFLPYLEVAASNGTEERLDDTVEKLTGQPAQNFDAWVQEVKKVWQ
jgi:festuclavine dehydrogenase